MDGPVKRTTLFPCPEDGDGEARVGVGGEGEAVVKTA